MPYIYKITSPTKRVYVGSTINYKTRFSSYKRLKCKSQVRLYRSFLKYGVDKHIFEVIIECNINDIYKYENYYGHLYNTLHKKYGLNCVVPKADSNFISRTEETRKKISENGKNKFLSNETKEKLRLANIGKTSPMKGKNYHTKESKIKMSKSHTGKKLKEITKKRISDALKNRLPKNHSYVIESKRKKLLLEDYNIIFESITDAADFFKVSASIISKMINHKKFNKFNLIKI